MAQQHINLGTPPNGTDGDTNRTAWGKTEANFNELFARPVAIGKNLLINGNFDFWQREVSLPASTASRYLADRWLTLPLTSTIAPSQQVFAVGQTDVPGGPTFFHRCVVASVAGAASGAIFEQRVENVRQSSGTKRTLSFWAKADGNKSISVEFVQTFGSGGSSDVNSIGVKKFQLSSAWQRFTTTVDLPSIVGKTINTSTSFLRVAFWLEAGSNYNGRTDSLGQQSGTFDFAQLQFEDGAIATDFERRPSALELLLCQRYYEKSYNLGVTPGAVTDIGIAQVYANGLPTGTHVAGGNCMFSVRKRGLPALTLYSPATGSAGVCRDFTGGADRSATATAYESGFRWNSLAGGSATTEYNYGAQWTAEAEL